MPDDALPKPENEFQIRPFLKLPPGEFPGAWRSVFRAAKEGKITPSAIRAAIRDLRSERTGSIDVPQKPIMRNSKRKLPLGQILVLLYETKRKVEKGETALAIAALERIENLLCRF